VSGALDIGCVVPLGFNEILGTKYTLRRGIVSQVLLYD
jgi:hypothetical protein